MLLEGRAGGLVGGLKQILTKHELSGAKRHCLEQVIGYLERNRKHMRYEICLAKAIPSAAGSLRALVATFSSDYSAGKQRKVCSVGQPHDMVKEIDRYRG